MQYEPPLPGAGALRCNEIFYGGLGEPVVFQGTEMLTLLRQEKMLLMALLVAGAAFALEHWLLNNGQIVALVGALVLVAAIVCASMRVAHHAESLAHKVGDPYGTMILTLVAVLVAVVILAIMMSNEASPTLVRDTIYSAVIF